MIRLPSIGDKFKLVEGLEECDTGISQSVLDEFHNREYSIIDDVLLGEYDDEQLVILSNGWYFQFSQIVLLEDEELKKGKIFRHFKGDLYLLLDIAQHTESGDELVIYKALYGDYKVYARPKDMFFGKVNKVKYPNATQEYRFELID